MDTKTLPLHFDEVFTQTITSPLLAEKKVTLDVLRLDKLHPVISGNKWFKLQYYFKEAHQLAKSTVATFGGAYSNHIIATAFACKVYGLESVGIIRGEKPAEYSATLELAEEYGMKLIFISRDQYRDKAKVAAEFDHLNWYWIDEGGYGMTGAKGAATILKYAADKHYTNIIASVGTGTMLAGIIAAAHPAQKVIGVSSMKGNLSLEEETKKLLPPNIATADFTILHDYHFGGYAKYTDELLVFMQDAYTKHNLPLDFVYTAKTFFAIDDLVSKDFFHPGSSLLMIHSGGLQGNTSLPAGTLSFL